MNYLQGLAIGHDWEYERMAELDAAFESYYENYMTELADDYKKGSFKEIDVLMDEVFEKIFDDPIKSLNFGRLVFGIFQYMPDTPAARSLNYLVNDEIETILKQRFNNRSE